MHNLEKLITEWRTSAATPNVSAETLDELETHLRETTDQLVRSGMTVPEAFQRAVSQLGAVPGIASELRKIDHSLWLPLKLAVGVAGLLALVMAVFVLNRFDARPQSLLLASHIFAVTLGYTITLLVGGLGICFVCQRACEDFATSRLDSINRASFNLAGIGLLFTLVGVVLAMVWAKTEWGRYWAWDSKEIGGLSVIIWLICYLLAHRFFKGSARGVLAISMLGNIIVSLAWFGPQMNGLHQYGWPNRSLLFLVAIVANLAFFAIGFLPAGWLRQRRVR